MSELADKLASKKMGQLEPLAPAAEKAEKKKEIKTVIKAYHRQGFQHKGKIICPNINLEMVADSIEQQAFLLQKVKEQKLYIVEVEVEGE